MESKIKLLSIGKRKVKKKNSQGWEAVVERYAPGMYELFSGSGEKDALEKVEALKPEIVLVLQSILEDSLADGLRLVEEIKRLHPRANIFVIPGMVDDEQEVFDAYIARGAYKCYSAPVSMDALFHDMFVALNLE